MVGIFCSAAFFVSTSRERKDRIGVTPSSAEPCFGTRCAVDSPAEGVHQRHRRVSCNIWNTIDSSALTVRRRCPSLAGVVHSHQAPAHEPTAQIAPGREGWASVMLDVRYDAQVGLCRRLVQLARPNSR